MRRSVHLLRESVARQIAAGEVIDRPASVVRELLDNAIDAGADAVSIHISGGGVTAVRVTDNGEGMGREDLELCWKSHATSKIDSLDDLDRLASLGFRGEALSSIAACSRMTITTRRAQETAALRLQVAAGEAMPIVELAGPEGTTVEAADLFYALPGRRRFLKSPGAESALCRAVAVEKALPFPNIEFRFFLEEEMKLFLPRVENLTERVCAAYPAVVDHALVHRVEARQSEFSIAAIVGGPSLYRRDRRYIQFFINNRRVEEYALVQAIHYAFQDHIPGGNFPVAFVFLSVDPALVDFNIHPAKREVRFRNLGEIHHALVVALRDYLGRFNRSFAGAGGAAGGQASEVGVDSAAGRNPATGDGNTGAVIGAPGRPGERGGTERTRGGNPWQRSLYAAEELPSRPGPSRDSSFHRPASEIAADLAPRPQAQPPSELVYYGQLFNLFLLAAKDDRFFVIDQHAAHERVLFEQFRSRRGSTQTLLVPQEIEATPDQETSLVRNKGGYRKLGIEIEKRSPGRWAVTSLPEVFRSLEKEIIEFILEERGDGRTLEQDLYARMSCRAAVKEGDPLDETAAHELIERVFRLENARCPHGRPIWHEISRLELYRLVGRI